MFNLFLVGAAPGRHANHDPDRHALFPYPTGSTGARLRDLLGLRMSDYLHIPRRNVIPAWPGSTGSGDAFPARLAREGAAKLLPHLHGHHVLFMGVQAARACGCEEEVRWSLKWHRADAFTWAVLPHPSGRNRWWNHQPDRVRAEEFLRGVGSRWVAEGLPLSTGIVTCLDTKP